REELSELNCVEFALRGHVAGCCWLKPGACTTRADRESGSRQAQREDKGGQVVVRDWLTGFLSI
ncbi:hypothetical protein A2U01_0073803, partial [Trifolium medium]|nr:hypothetical protein [Trifolium medium]